MLSFAGGGAVGLVFGAVSFGLRRWPGGYLTATAMQFLIVYLVLGFLVSSGGSDRDSHAPFRFRALNIVSRNVTIRSAPPPSRSRSGL